MTTTDIEAEQSDDGWGVLDALPGHPMMWILILSELLAFGLLLGAFSIARLAHQAVFAAGQAAIDPRLAVANTVVLVTSGWCAARGAAAARSGDRRAAPWLGGAIGLGLVFVAVKVLEYAGDIARGLDIETSTFFTLYYLLTGFHLLHVLLGIVILAVVGRHGDADDVETGTAFWHMVDLVWLLMFPVVYLVR